MIIPRAEHDALVNEIKQLGCSQRANRARIYRRYNCITATGMISGITAPIWMPVVGWLATFNEDVVAGFCGFGFGLMPLLPLLALYLQHYVAFGELRGKYYHRPEEYESGGALASYDDV